MKRLYALVLAVVVIVGSASFSVYATENIYAEDSVLQVSAEDTPKAPGIVAGNGISIYVENKLTNFGVRPQIIDGRIYVSAQELCSVLNLRYIETNCGQTISIYNEKHILSAVVGSKVSVVDGMIKSIDCAPVHISGVIMIPVRGVGECFGLHVLWNEATRTVYISSGEIIIKNTMYDNTDFPDFGNYSGIACDFSENIAESDGGNTYTYKYKVSRYHMYSSGAVHGYLDEIIRRGWVTDGIKYEQPQENMMYYYFEKGNCRAAVSLVRDAASNTYSLWVTYTVY